MPVTQPHLANFKPRNPLPITRKRLYATAAAIFAILGAWGVVTIDEATQLLEVWDKLLGAGALLLAARNTKV